MSHAYLFDRLLAMYSASLSLLFWLFFAIFKTNVCEG
jgi:hypothetical protein